MAAAFVQHKESFTASSSTPTLVFTSNVTAGSCIALFIRMPSVTTTITSVSDDFGSTWVVTAAKNTNFPSAGDRGSLAYGYNATGGAKTITVTLSAAVNARITAHEISGCLTTDPIDGTPTLANQTSPGTGTDAVTSGNITTSADGAYIFGTSADENATTTFTAGTNFTIEDTSTGDSTEYRIQSSAGSVAATFTSNQVTANYQTGILAFKPASVAGISGATAPTLFKLRGYRVF